MVIITIFILHTNQAAASPFTVVTIELEERPVSVDVSPGSSGIVTVLGNVTCVKWGPDQVKVALVGNSSEGGTSISPPNMVFGGTSGSEESEEFTATAKVPQGSPCTESGTIIVSGTWVQGGLQYTIEPVSSIFVIEQYYMIDMLIADREYTIDAGEDVDFDVVLQNNGNGDDIIEIDILNREDLKKNGISLPSPSQLNVPYQLNKSANMKIGTSDETTGRYIIEISSLSKGSEKNGFPIREHSTVSLVVRENEDFAGELGSMVVSPIVFEILSLIVVIVIIYKVIQR
jgi:hypothetical protein